MKVVTPEGYTFVTKFQEDNFHKVLRSVDFFSIKFDEIFFDNVCWERRDSRIFTEMDLEETKKENILLTVNKIETKLDELNLKQHEKDT